MASLSSSFPLGQGFLGTPLPPSPMRSFLSLHSLQPRPYFSREARTSLPCGIPVRLTVQFRREPWKRVVIIAVYRASRLVGGPRMRIWGTREVLSLSLIPILKTRDRRR